MNTPQLSIITPVYNGQKYMAQFLQRVIDQNCPSMEHIIVDGQSSDDTVKIIKSFADKYSHIRWMSEKDRGVGDALNKGLAMARGKIIGVLALDDCYQPGALNEILKSFQSLSEPSFLMGNCNVWDEKGELVSIIKPKGLSPLKILFGYQYSNPAAYFYHKSLHQKVGLYGIEEPIDLDFLLRVYSLVNVHYVDRILGDFRLTPDSITLQSDVDGTQDANVNKIIQRYLQILPVGKRIVYRTSYRAVATFKRTKRTIRYFFRRFLHYAQNPKDIERVLKKILNLARNNEI